MNRHPLMAQAVSARGARVLSALALVVITLATYAHALGNGYVWDDQVIVVENPDNQQLSEWGRVWTSPDVITRSQTAPYYRPLTRLSFVLDGWLFQLDPRATHLENLLLHLGAVLLLFALGRRLFQATAPAFIAALWLAVHPINAEPVAFVTARNNLLVGVFVLAACLLYLQGRQTGGTAVRLGAGALFFLGLLCKEPAFMLLPFLVLYELATRTGSKEQDRSALLSLLPLTAATALYLVMRARVLSSVVGQPVHLADLGRALVQDLHLIPQYFSLLLFPRGLTIHYAAPATYFAHPGLLVGAWAVIGGLLAYLLRQGRPVTRFGLGWFALHFVTVSGIVPLPSAPLADRYLYLPAIGLWLVAADQLELLRRRPAFRRAVTLGIALLAGSLAIRTAVRTGDWKDNLALFQSAVRVDPRSVEASYNLGLALLHRGESDQARRELDKGHSGALAQLGTWHAAKGELERALGYFTAVLEHQPRDVETRFNLGLLMERMGRPAEALRYYQEFLALQPVDYPEVVPRVRERVVQLKEQQ
jgi:hypothetical protein